MNRVKHKTPGSLRAAAFAATLLMLFSLAACSGGSNADFVLNEEAVTLEVGDTCQLSVSAKGLRGYSVTWETSSENVATVDEDGLVTALTSGTATVSAVMTSGKKQFVRYADITVGGQELEQATVAGDENKPIPEDPNSYILDSISDGVLIDERTQNLFLNNAGGDTQVYFKASEDETFAKQWELSGKVKVLNGNRGQLGFLLRDGNGKEQMIAIFRDHMALSSTGSWSDYTELTGYGTYMIFNQPACSFYWGESQFGGKTLNYKLVLKNDKLEGYFWNDDERFCEPTLVWTIPLTQSQFGGFAKGTSYQLGICSTNTSTYLKLLSTTVKTGDAISAE